MTLNMRTLYITIVAVIVMLGVTACGGSNSSTSSGGNTGVGPVSIHEMHRGQVMVPGQEIPLQQSVHIHESGIYPVVVERPMTLTLECSGSVNYSYNHNGQIESGMCDDQRLALPIAGSGTIQFDHEQGADIGLELHI